MLNWLQLRRLLKGDGDGASHAALLQSGNILGTTRKGKRSVFEQAIESTGALPGDTIAIDCTGQARIVGRPLCVAVDNSSVQKLDKDVER